MKLSGCVLEGSGTVGRPGGGAAPGVPPSKHPDDGGRGGKGAFDALMAGSSPESGAGKSGLAGAGAARARGEEEGEKDQVSSLVDGTGDRGLAGVPAGWIQLHEAMVALEGRQLQDAGHPSPPRENALRLDVDHRGPLAQAAEPGRPAAVERIQYALTLGAEAGASQPADPRAAAMRLPDSGMALEFARGIEATEAALRSLQQEAAALKEAAEGRARSPLLALLGERLQVQLAARSESAVMRLHPASLGSIEILVRHEGGNVHVQLNASASEVARQLHAISEGLRQELSQRHAGQVQVHVGHAWRDGDARQRSRQHEPEANQPGQSLNQDDAMASLSNEDKVYLV